MTESVEFDWDEQNEKHLKSHRVSPEEFEQVIANNPLDLEYQVEGGEERYRALGITENGRILIVVWTVRDDKVRAVTAYPAGRSYLKLYWEMRR